MSLATYDNHQWDVHDALRSTDLELRVSSFWLGTLAASIHGHVTDEQPSERLERDLREFLESSACSDELREMLT